MLEVPSIDRRPGAPPVYLQIAAFLRQAIAAEQYPIGAQIPSGRQLAELLGVERNTADKAVAELRAAGLVETQQGRGVFVVAAPRVHRRARLRIGQQAQGLGWRGFYADVQAGGSRPMVQTTISRGPAPEQVATLLDIEPDVEVLIRDRRMGDEQGPLQLSTSWFHPSTFEAIPRLAEQDTGPGGMYARMEEEGYQLRQQVINRVRMPTADEAQLLELPAMTPIFDDLWVTINEPDGRVLEVNSVRAHGSRMQFLYEL